MPSSPTLRQRMDAQASACFELSGRINKTLLSMRTNGQAVDFGSLPCGYTPLDVDTFVMDNEDTAKELVGRTYTGMSILPIASYPGTAGFCLEQVLRRSSPRGPKVCPFA